MKDDGLTRLEKMLINKRKAGIRFCWYSGDPDDDIIGLNAWFTDFKIHLDKPNIKEPLIRILTKF